MASLAEHNERLSRAGLPTVETLTRRILAVWDRATPHIIEHGATWYSGTGQIVTALAAKHGHSVETVAGVFSALSPRTPWARNVAGAVLLIETGDVFTGLLGRNVENARRILAGEPVREVLRGPKTSAFAANLAGDTERVTVDVWAARVAGVDETLLTRVGIYDALEVAYQRAARRVGVEPSTMQATTWIVARNGRKG